MNKKNYVAATAILALLVDSCLLFYAGPGNNAYAAVDLETISLDLQNTLNSKNKNYGDGSETLTFDVKSAEKDNQYTYKYNNYSKDLKSEYGKGDKEKYYKWKNQDWAPKQYELEETSVKPESDKGITYKYSEQSVKHDRIKNDGQTLTEQTGDFENQKTWEDGAAIQNQNNGRIGDITGNFVNNQGGNGGAVSNNNNSSLGNINGNFIGNSSNQNGGAIRNENSTIEDITGDFVGNHTNGQGGAIYNINQAKIGDIKGDFIGNYTWGQGGAVYNGNNSTIDNIIGSFVGNRGSNGGAIYNTDSSSIQSIVGDFIRNTSTSGAAVQNVNNSTIGKIAGDFIGNYGTNGGAIFNQNGARIDGIESNFIGNTGNPGGAINNENAVIGNITGNFIDNSAGGNGGAIYNHNNGKIGVIKGDFIGNTANPGGAIHNEGYSSKIDGIKGNFVANSSSGDGGAIYNQNQAEIGDITGDFAGNKTTGNGPGGAIANSNSKIGNIKGNFIGNETSSNGGAVQNRDNGSIESITGDFIANKAGDSNPGGAIDNANSRIGSIIGDFIGNHGGQGGAINNRDNGKLDYISGDFIENSATMQGGAIYNQNGNIELIKNSNFVNNSGKWQGGAIYSESDIKIEADNGNSIFQGNYIVDDQGNKESEAVYQKNSKLTLSAKNNGMVHFNDKINGENYDLHFTGDKSGNININNDVKKARISQDNVVSNIYEGKYLSNKDNTLTMNSGDMNVVHLDLQGMNLNQLNLNGGRINFNNIDVDLENRIMGRLTANSYGEIKDTVIDVQGVTVLKDGEDMVIPVEFADNAFKNNVQSSVKKAEGPIYMYDVSYNNVGDYGDPDKGYMVFSRSSGSDGTPSFSPSIQASPVAQQLGGEVAITRAIDFSFHHIKTFSSLPSNVKTAMKNANKYAVNEGDARLGLYEAEVQKNSFWIRPYTAFESVPLKNNYKVKSINYGTIVGADTNIIPLKRGWDFAFTGFAGFNGSSQTYSGVHNNQNGGLLGATGTFYKGNFYTALTVLGGGDIGESSTRFGDEDYYMLTTGVASKSGYTFEFKDGRFILNPSVVLSYTFVNTFDYTNAAGVRISSEPLHSIQLHPELKFVINTETSWQPYILASVMFNIMNDSKVMANNIELPSIAIKPYAEYGIGIQKHYNDKYTGYAQVTARNGGRNGVALTFGFRWALDNRKPKTETVKIPKKKRNNSIALNNTIQI